ncbi:MAG TPA: alpha/beta hydrolase [Dehalococcoidia bacterium]|nr:alpha/beta hydrolase [Dehalococcoidia bacterium]
MENLRRYGRPPFRVALLHGGPGAPGEMAPVARELSSAMGVLEPLQTETSLHGQLLELKDVLEADADLPVALVGSSWGAILAFVFAARYPHLVRKLVLVGSAPFEERYAAAITQTRLGRLSEAEAREAIDLRRALEDAATPDKGALFARLGRLLATADSFDPLTLDDEVLEYQPDISRSVWADARELRASGELLALGRKVECPVVAVHGDYDPHPAEGVREPLATVLSDFKFVLLKGCGHHPWIERRAKDEFYRVLNEELL